MRILFDSKLSQFKTPFGVLRPGEVCTLHIQIPVSCQTEHVELLLLQEDGTPAREVSLSRQETGALYECFGAAFSLERAGLYFYCFRVTTKNEQFRLYKQGNDTNMEAGDFWQLSCVEDAYPVPEALRGAVMYQIFPDRFYQSGCCNCAEKLQPYWVHEDKSDVPVYLPDEHGEVLNNDFYGGNLNGIREKLPYLQELGVEILYLNPIFMAFSTHRYDTYDYKRIDPMLGTEADFSALCSRAHALGMKVVLDGVFSHVGSRSPYFQSAISNPDSPYRNWFQFKHYPDVYESWWGITTLPCVDKMNESYIRYMQERIEFANKNTLRTVGEAGVSSAELYSKIVEIANTVQGLASQIASLNGDVTALSGSVNTLSGSVATMQGQINNVQEQISTINASLQSLEQRVSALEQKQTTPTA